MAIRTPDALYYPLTLPFGPASGPANFQMRVTEILGDLEGHGVASYIDDLGLYATTFEEYLQRFIARPWFRQKPGSGPLFSRSLAQEE